MKVRKSKKDCVALVPLRVEVGSMTSSLPEKRWVLICEKRVAERPKKASSPPETVPEVDTEKLDMLAASAARYLRHETLNISINFHVMMRTCMISQGSITEQETYPAVE